MNQVFLEPLTAVNPTWSSIWNASQMAGGADSAHPYKNRLEAILTQIFHITQIWGQK